MTDLTVKEAMLCAHAILTAELNDDHESARTLLLELDDEAKVAVMVGLCTPTGILIETFARALGKDHRDFLHDTLTEVGQRVAQLD